MCESLVREMTAGEVWFVALFGRAKITTKLTRGARHSMYMAAPHKSYMLQVNKPKSRIQCFVADRYSSASHPIQLVVFFFFFLARFN